MGFCTYAYAQGIKRAMSKLVIEDQRGRRTNVPLKKSTVTVGRQEGATIRLVERNVSRRHLELRRERGELFVVDLSRYGSMLNGKRFSGRTKLYDGDVLVVGGYKLHIELDEPAPDPRPDVPEAWIDYGIPRLVRLQRGVAHTTWRLQGSVRIGRAQDVDIRIDSTDLLPTHCLITPEEDGWWLRVADPASTVQINGKPAQRRRMQRGDRIQLGGQIYRWVPESQLSASSNPATVGDAEDIRPTWHRWEAVGMLAGKV